LHSGHGKFAIRQGDWVFIHAQSGDDNGVNGEPMWNKPEIVKRLKALLKKYKTDGSKRAFTGPVIIAKR
jgi:hypothetical protein